jgi:hypothetical protein
MFINKKNIIMITEHIHFLRYSIEVTQNILRARSKKSILLILGSESEGTDARRELATIHMTPHGDVLEHRAPHSLGSLTDDIGSDAFQAIITSIYRLIISQPKAQNHLDSWLGKWEWSAHANEDYVIDQRTITFTKK